MKIKRKSNEFYENIKSIFPLAQKQRIDFIELFIIAIVKCAELNYKRIANMMDTAVKSDSNYRRIQRFVAEFKIGQASLARWIVRRIEVNEHGRLTLAMDRTNWKFGKANINYLVLAVCYKGMAVPIFWKLLNKRGNSSTKERIELVKRFITTFGSYRIDYLLADREFIGKDWQAWLIAQQIPFYIRIRNDAVICVKGSSTKASRLFKNLQCGETKFKNMLIEVYGTEVYLSGKKIMGKRGGIDYVILISYFEPRQCFEKYRMRWQIEHLFKALKSGGFNMESTHVTDLSRLETILGLLTIAFFWAYKTGEWVIQKGIDVIRIMKHGRAEKSIFKLGLEYLTRAVSTVFSPYSHSVSKVLSCT